MKNRFSKTVVVLVLAAAVVAPVSVLAQSGSSVLDSQKAEDQTKLEGVEHELTSIQDRKVQLEKTVAATKDQQAKTTAEINRLQADANTLVPQIDAKTKEQLKVQKQLAEAIELDYKSRKNDALGVVIAEGSMSNTLKRGAYLNQIEKHMDELATQVEHARHDLADKKSNLDNKRSTAELAKRQLAALEASIGQQQTELQELEANKDNEAQYLQERIAKSEQMQAELAKGGNAIWGTFTNGARVKQGDVIGFEGSTGFSTGCHMHFSVIDGGRWSNPAAYFGYLQQPAGRNTQGFGMTDWAKSGVYGGSIHNGMDYVQGCGSPIRAAADGTVVRDNRTDGSGFGHYIMIRHDNGLMTLYGHMI